MDKATELVESISPTVHLRGYMLHREIPDFSGQSNARLIPFQGMQTSKWLTQQRTSHSDSSSVVKFAGYRRKKS